MKLASITTSLKRKIGPLPMWAWLGVAAAVIVVVRRLRGGTPATPTSTGPAALPGGSTGSDYGRVGSADGGGAGLDPTQQGYADPALSGPGTAVVYDPLTGGTTTSDPTTSAGGAADGVDPSTKAAAETPMRPRAVALSTAEVAVGKRAARSVVAVAHAAPEKKRPKSSRGARATAPRVAQTHQAPELISEHGAGQVHPPAAKAKTQATPTRVIQTAAPAAVERPRTSAPAHVDTGARAPAVGTTTSSRTYASMGRKGELV